MKIKFGGWLGVLALWLSHAGCAPQKALHSTYGNVYGDVMGKQLSNHSSRPLAPLRGREATRFINAYYEGLGNGNVDAVGASSRSAGSASPATSSPSLAPTSAPP